LIALLLLALLAIVALVAATVAIGATGVLLFLAGSAFVLPEVLVKRRRR
jgi:hypothetical protein